MAVALVCSVVVATPLGGGNGGETGGGPTRRCLVTVPMGVRARDAQERVAAAATPAPSSSSKTPCRWWVTRLGGGCDAPFDSLQLAWRDLQRWGHLVRGAIPCVVWQCAYVVCARMDSGRGGEGRPLPRLVCDCAPVVAFLTYFLFV